VTSRLAHRLALCTAVGVALALIAGCTATQLTTTGSDGPNSVPVRLSAAPLGVNVAPWDYLYAEDPPGGGGANVMQRLLKAAGIRQLRFGGGSYADYYDWQTNTTAGNCLPYVTTASFTSGCASAAPLGFRQFSRRARDIGANSFVTVNYGSGTPSQAAAWVAQAARTTGEGVALWEVGNETYGCWEVDNELAGPPAYYKGYRPVTPSAPSGTSDRSACPRTTQGNRVGTRTLASSYAANAQRFMTAMRAVDPSAQIGVPWAFGSQVPGSAVADSSEWNSTVLSADGKGISFVDAHYYPFKFSGRTGGANPTDQQVLRSLLAIPSLFGSIRAELSAYDPRASVVIGETAVSNQATTTNCTPVGALFAIGDALSWLSAGAETVDWWDVNNYGNRSSHCVNPDYGFFTSSKRPATETPYYGYLLASKLAKPHALLGTLGTSDPSNVLAFQSALPDGTHTVALININTESAQTVTFRASDWLSGTLRTWLYDAHNPESSAIVTGTTSVNAIANGIVLPAESITVLQTP
jgi:hypothetical protein